MPLFRLGQCVATPAAIEFMERQRIDALELLTRHRNGDWGQLSKEDVDANTNALAYGARIFSSYVFNNEKLWIITEADRSSTCILLPDDY